MRNVLGNTNDPAYAKATERHDSSISNDADRTRGNRGTRSTVLRRWAVLVSLFSLQEPGIAQVRLISRELDMSYRAT